MNHNIKNLILYKANFYKTFVLRKTVCSIFLTFHNLQNHLKQFIQKTKQNYLRKVAKKFSDPSASSKCFWSLLKTLLSDKKYHVFHLYFIIKIVNFKEKSGIFNTFFAEQCSLIPNKSVLLSQLTLLTENSLSKVIFLKRTFSK